MSEYLSDDHGVFSAIAPGMALPPTSLWSNAGNDVHITATFIAGFNINIEHPLQPLSPGHGCAAFCWCLVLFVIYCYGFFAFTSFGWRYQCPVFAIGCEYAMETGEVYSGSGNQSDQPGEGRSCASCARGIPYVLYIKSNGSNMTWVVPLRQGVFNS